MNLCEGSTYIVNLSSFIRSHEFQLIKAFLGNPRKNENNNDYIDDCDQIVKPVRLSITLHHLYFLLDCFRQSALKTGPLNIRLYDINYDYTMNYDTLVPQQSQNSPSLMQQYQNSPPSSPVAQSQAEQQEYVSFMSNNYHARKSKRMSTYSSSVNSNDNSSISSMSSVKSALSSIWHNISSSDGNGNGNNNHGYNYGTATPMEDSLVHNPVIASHLNYLHTFFAKLPCLRISPDLNSRLIKDYQEFPFDTIVPLNVFKNLLILEINETNPKEIFGWHLLAQSLRFLIIKNTDLNNNLDALFVDLVWQDLNNRNFKQQHHHSVSLPEGKKKKQTKQHKQSKHKKSSKKLQDKYLNEKWQNVKYLSLINTNLTELREFEMFKFLKNLSSLDLSQNGFTEIPLMLGKLPKLKNLNLSQNRLTNIKNFERLVDKNGEFILNDLAVLDLKGNEITSLDGIELLHNLTKIDVSNNKINYLRDVRSLFLSGVFLVSNNKLNVFLGKDAEVGTENISIYFNDKRVALKNINLIGNPITSYDKNYRIKLFNLFKVFDWVRQGLKINNSKPSYLENYYLMNDSNILDKNSILNTNHILFLNFKKYLFSTEEYYHQLKARDLDKYADKNQKTFKEGTVRGNENDNGENENVTKFPNDTVKKFAALNINDKKFPETFATKPIVVAKRNSVHSTKSIILNNSTNNFYSTTALSPTNVAFKSSADPVEYEPSSISSSRSLNNLLNLSQSLKLDNGGPKRHERTKSAISYQSTNTITE